MQISGVARAVSTSEGKAVLEVAGRPFFQLNPVAAAIWSKLVQGQSIQEIIGQLTMQFGIPEERVSTDVTSFIQTLKQNDLVKDSVRTPNFHAELVWNKGIAARCDWRIPEEFPSGLGKSRLLYIQFCSANRSSCILAELRARTETCTSAHCSGPTKKHIRRRPPVSDV